MTFFKPTIGALIPAFLKFINKHEVMLGVEMRAINPSAVEADASLHSRIVNPASHTVSLVNFNDIVNFRVFVGMSCRLEHNNVSVRHYVSYGFLSALPFVEIVI